ncbi:MAG: antibiotic biosynthesis monooxygenase, partial [Phenylobacterium sp.]|nr:antibiotic biosynthesis monooxygenase [Phenylobacterium sp.]
MIGVIAVLKVAEGKNAEFEAIFTDLAKQVRANEPGNIAYQLT